jgi:GNAT superfamily N-acetyltransferase
MGKNLMIIKPMRATDIDGTAIIMEYYRDEANLPDGEYDPDVMLQTIKEYTISPDACWFNAYDGTRIVGLVAGYVMQLPWSTRLTAHVQFIFLLPAYRNLANGHRLLKEFEGWAAELGCTSISGGDIGIDTERTRVFYASAGYSERGCNLTKEFTDV